MTDKEYQDFKQSMFRFFWNDLYPVTEEMWRTTGIVPEKEFLPKMAGKRLCGLIIPEKYGGVGLTVSQYLPIVAESAKINLVIRGILHMANTTARGIVLYAREEQKQEYLPQLAKGDLYMAFGLTEANSGSGADSKTTAVRQDNNYIINGEKHLITCSGYAKLFQIFCCTNPARGPRGFSTILVDRNTPGFTIEPHLPLMGQQGGDHGILTFRDCTVPVDMVLGEEGNGLEMALGELEASRVFVAASSLGVMERALELSLQRANERITFGKPIGQRDAVRGYLADMATEVYALRSMLVDTSKKIDAGQRCPVEASACKLLGMEAVCRVTEKALLVFGGIGYTRKYDIERLHREARINLLEEGTPSIQRLVIARTLLAGYSW